MADDAYVSLEADPEATAEASLRDAMAAVKGAAASDAPDEAGEDTPAVPTEPAPTTPPATAAAAPEADEDAGEDAPAGKTVPYQALREAREHMKTLKAQVAEIETLRAKAAQADQVLPIVEQWRPVIEAIQRDPSLVERVRQPQSDPYEAKVSDAEAADYAKDIQLYTPEGKLDVVTAKRALAREHKIASVAAQEAARSVVAPLQRESVQLKAQQARDWALRSAEQEGDPVDQAVFDGFWNNLPAELIAQNPAGLGQLVKILSRGSVQRKAAPAPPPPPVMHTETPGGRTPAVAALTDLDRRFAKEIGRKPSEYQAVAAKFRLGDINVLED